MRSLLILISCTLTLGNASFSQCSHDPTISPSNLILCPDESDTLWTQAYDSYQWSVDGNPISGANDQYLVVDYSNYSATMITVEATMAGCSEESPSVLVDGWVFIPPYVISSGDYTYNPQTAAMEVCLNDTLFLEFGLPYEVNIQWTVGGSPIPGETNSIIEITSSSVTGILNYNVCGSPAVCPNYVQCLGVPLNVQFVDCANNDVDEIELTFNIYPNPATSHLTVEIQGMSFASDYVITDHLGRVLSFGSLAAATTEIDIRELPSGVYFLTIDKHSAFKFSVE